MKKWVAARVKWLDTEIAGPLEASDGVRDSVAGRASA
jgi:hypothetical protein